MSLRVASLLPAATELVCALGAADRLVGVSHECDFPPAVRGLPVLTRARLHAPGPSGAIDRALRELVAAALAVYEVDLDALGAARPDVIVTQDLCHVCAIPREAVTAALAEVGLPGTRVVSLQPLRTGEVLDGLIALGAALGLPDAGHRAAAALQARIDALAARALELRGSAPPPRVLTLEWLDPPMVGGLWMPELIAWAAGAPLLVRPGQHAPTLTRAALAALDPDLVLLKPCGFELARTLSELPALPRLLPLEAWPRARLVAADGNAYFNRPGPRLVESLEVLLAALYPAASDLRRTHAASAVDLVPTPTGWTSRGWEQSAP